MITIDKINTAKKDFSSVILFDENSSNFNNPLLCESQSTYILNSFKEEKRTFFVFNRLDSWVIAILYPIKKTGFATIDNLRKLGAKILDFCDKEHIKNINLLSECEKEEMLAFVEGAMLASYCFDNYKTDADRLIHPFDHISIIHEDIEQKDIEHIRIICEAIEKCKDLVNEPYNSLNAEGLASSFEKMAKEANIDVKVFHQQEIEKMK